MDWSLREKGRILVGIGGMSVNRRSARQDATASIIVWMRYSTDVKQLPGGRGDVYLDSATLTHTPARSASEASACDSSLALPRLRFGLVWGTPRIRAEVALSN